MYLVKNFRPGPKNLITDISGILVGNAEDLGVNSGTTILSAKTPFLASCKVLGGAPGTRETDLLEPDKLVQKIDALVLSGGSAFGLEAASAVTNELRKDNRGFKAGEQKVPIVPSAIIFDLANGGNKAWVNNPYADLGTQAYKNLNSSFKLGSYGAGKGAIAGALKGGLGSASLSIFDKFMVGALVVVNSFGNSTVGDLPYFWSAPFEIENEFGGFGMANQFEFSKALLDFPLNNFSQNTVVGIVATNANLTKSQCKILATSSHDGIARAVFPSHTSFDGDLIFAISTGQEDLIDENNETLLICQAASICVARAIARGVYNATISTGDLVPNFLGKFHMKG